MRVLIYTVLLFYPLLITGQENTVDSLLELARKEQVDSARARIYVQIAEEIGHAEPERAISYAWKAYQIGDKANNKKVMDESYRQLATIYYFKGVYDSTLHFQFKRLERARKDGNMVKVADLYNNIGKMYYYLGDYEEAFQNFTRSNELSEQLGNKKQLAETNLTLGAIFYEQGNYQKALENYFNSLEITEELEDTVNMSYATANIGSIYSAQGKFEEALDYYNKTLSLQKAIHEDQEIISTYNTIGNLYQEYDALDTSLMYYSKAMNKSEEMNNKRGLGITYNNLGQINLRIAESWKDNGRVDSATFYYNRAQNYYSRSLTINNEIGEYEEISLAYQGMGDVYSARGLYREAIQYLLEAKQMGTQTASPYTIKESSGSLHEAYAAIGNYKKAYQEHKMFKNMTDSLKNEEKVEAITQVAMQYKFDKKKKQMEYEHQAELRRKRWIQQVSISGLGVAMLFALVLYRSFRRKQRDNRLLEKQKAQIEEHKEAITDSILYAQKIQEAILPNQDFMNQILRDYFILFKPRDIVSGDFYWMSKKNGKIFVVAADCTGHGVPGAFMSMLGVSFLNEIVNKTQVEQCNVILDNLREYVISSLHQTGRQGEAKDGMDLAMIILDPHTGEVQFSGANNPLYLVRPLTPEEKNSPQPDSYEPSRGIMRNDHYELQKITPDKMPIGIHVKQKPFSNHLVKLDKGYTIYLFSDGFVDQFGGPNKKKFMVKPFKRLLLSIQDEPMEKQREILNNTLEDWMKPAGGQQVDDILVLGLKI